MPELPEVKAFTHYVNETCLHKKIIKIACQTKHLIKGITFEDFTKDLQDKSFDHAERKGKYLIIPIQKSDEKLVFHFGLTGTIAVEKDFEEKVPFWQLMFLFDDKSCLYWINKRKFGKVWLLKQLDQLSELTKLGTDALKITQEQFLKLTEEHKTKNIKAFLMDQELIAGIGNEYSDEILFQSGIDPHCAIKYLSQKQLHTLYKQMEKVLTFATKIRMEDVKDPKNETIFTVNNVARFPSSYLQAHRHTDGACPKNSDHKLKKVTIAGRSTYYCPKDQT